MDKIRKMIPYLLVIIFAFYILPLIINDTGTGMIILLIGIPIICFITSFIYGMKNVFNWLFPILVTSLFIPTIFIFYNESAAFYSVVYGLITVVGSFIGSYWNKQR